MKEIEQILAPLLNFADAQGIVGRLKRQRELEKVAKNRRKLNRAIRQGRIILECFKS
jgi:hypothetical protein